MSPAPPGLVGTDRRRIVVGLTWLFGDQDTCQAISRAHNHYGDGQTSAHIVDAIARRR
jgi:UDP-N-acetylglucosamine 2-epimerase (non-hydrolysing)